MKTFFKKTIFLSLLLALINQPTLALAQAEELETIEEVQSRINQIVERMRYLQGVLGDLPVTDTDLPDTTLTPPIDQIPTLTGALILRYDLRLGARDKNTAGEVSLLQNFLKSQGYFNKKITGTFSVNTKKAVIVFQNRYKKKLGISRGTGFVGILTRRLIAELTGGSPLAVVADASRSSQTSFNQVSFPSNNLSNTNSLSNFLTSTEVAKPTVIALAITKPLSGSRWEIGFSQDITWRGPETTYNVYAESKTEALAGVSYLLASNLTEKRFSWRAGSLMSGGTLPAGAYLLKVCEKNNNCTSLPINLVTEDTGLRYQIKTDQFSYPAGSSVGVTISAINDSSLGRDFALGHCQIGFRVYAREQSNKLVYDSLTNENCLSDIAVSIAPATSRSWPLSFKADLTVGIYDIKAVVNGSERAITDFTIR